MPVIFVVLKSLSTTVSTAIHSLTHFMGTQVRLDKMPPSQSGPMNEGKPSWTGELAPIPKVHLRTLRSMLGMGARTRTNDSLEDLTATNVSEIDTNKDLYHVHITTQRRQ
jgi:hypothetical protein